VPSVEERVIQIVCDNLGVNKEQVTRKTSFIEDVGADSLAYLSLEGMVAAAGSPEEVVTPELLRSVYGVELEVHPSAATGRPVVALDPPFPVRPTTLGRAHVVGGAGRGASVMRDLAERDIETGIHYPVPIHRQPAWLRIYGEGPALPRAERAAREILSLPVHADLSDEEVERVADGVRDFFRR